MNKTYVIGDIHGAHKALLQCLDRSDFDYENDTLIQLGDVCDGWSETYECVEELLKIKNLIFIRGNHDAIFLEWMRKGQHPWAWLQGGYGTALSYIKHADREINIIPRLGGYTTSLTNVDIPKSHIKFFKQQLPYYVDKENRLFVHGGFNRHFHIDDQMHNNEDILMWDRDLWSAALSYNSIADNKYSFKMLDDFKEVYIGHTTTMCWSEDTPMNAANIWNLDTGAGFKGKLTIMNIDTKEYFQSDLVQELYKDEKGRN